MTTYLTYLKRKPRTFVQEGRVLCTEIIRRRDVTREILPDKHGRYTVWTPDGKVRNHLLVNGQLVKAPSRMKLPEEIKQQRLILYRQNAARRRQERALAHRACYDQHLLSGFKPLKFSVTEVSDRYLVNTQATVLDSHRKCKAIAVCTDRAGYQILNLQHPQGRATFLLHRLVAFTFLSETCFETAEVNHKNLDKSDCSVSNLEWVTRAQNVKHYWEWKNTGKTDVRIITN